MAGNKKPEVKKFVWGFLDSNMYLLEEDNHFLVIDPIDEDAALEKCSEASSVMVFLTHEHFDHISGLNRLRFFCCGKNGLKSGVGDRRFNQIQNNAQNRISCKVIASETCSEGIQDARANLSAYADVLAALGGKQITNKWEPFVCEAADAVFSKNYLFFWMGHSVELFYTPGHSAGSSCLLLDDMLFVGDTILKNNLMVQFPGSSKKLYKEVTVPILKKLLARAKSVFPGHGDTITPDVAMSLLKVNSANS